jgi:hypothetical protein
LQRLTATRLPTIGCFLFAVLFPPSCCYSDDPRVRERYGLLYKSSCQKNTSPSTGRREDFRDIQRLSAWKTLVGCPWIDFALFLLSRRIFYMVATTPIGFKNYARPAVVRCQPWAYRRFVAWTKIHQPGGGSTHVSRIAQKSISQLSTLESVSNVCHDRLNTDLSPRFRRAARR